MKLVLLKSGAKDALLTTTSNYRDVIAESQMAESRIVSMTAMPGSKEGRAQKVVMLNAMGQMVEGVAKDHVEKDMRKGNIPPYTEWRRERLAYLVSQIVGLCNVPAVVVRRIDGQIGSVMMLVPGDTWRASGLEFDDINTKEWQKLAVLDWIICDTDRHRRNWIVDDERRFWAIDNDLSFPEKTQWGPFEGYRSRPHWYLSENNDLALADDIARLFTSIKKRDILVQMVKFGIGQMGRAIFSARWDYIVANKALPTYVESEKGFMQPMGE